MAVTKAQKSEILKELKENFKKANSISFTSNSGLTVAEMSELRKSLREVSASFTLAKKTLIKLAMKEVHNVELNYDLLPWQIAVICSYDDAIAGMTKTNDFIKAKADRKLGEIKITWSSSYFEGQVQDKVATKEIASMPSKETLLGRLVGSMQAPLSSLARFLDAASKKLTEEGKDTLGSVEVKKVEVKAETPKVEEVKVEEVKQEVVAEEIPAVTEEAVEVTQVEAPVVAEEVIAVAQEEISTPEETKEEA